MVARCFHFVSVLVVVALLFSAAAPARAADNGGGNDGKSGSNGKGPDKPKKNRPTARVQGDYFLRIAGYYTGSGTARASSEGIKITARVKDPANNTYSFQAKSLTIVDDRFTGTGLLNDTEVQIDGRLDPRDKGNEVLKKGRMTFTFSVDGHHARGAGNQN